MSFLASMLAEKGFTCIETNLTIPDESNKDSGSMMKDYESGKTFNHNLAMHR